MLEIYNWKLKTIYKGIKNMKCSGINLIRDVKELFPENYQVFLKLNPK